MTGSRAAGDGGPAPHRVVPARVLVVGLVVALLVQAGWVAFLLLPPLPERLEQPDSVVVDFRDGTPAFVFLTPDDKLRMAVSPEDLGGGASAVDPAFVDALVRFEDRRFRLHPGIDPLAVVRAAVDNLRSGEVVSGASTLTLQLVRMLEPRPRSLGSKIVESLRALQVEARLSKPEILAAYLTFAPYGGNVEGVRAASWSLFGHGPESLSPGQVATLLAIPQSPSRRRPSPGNAERLRQARDRIGRWLVDRQVFETPAGTPSDPLGAGAVPTALRPLPRSAPHAAFHLREAARPSTSEGPLAESSAAESSSIPTTLDRGLQRTAESLMRAARDELRSLGVHNGAVVLVENETRAVRALVGNFDFWDEDHGGQVAGFAAPRSPGSALKPLIYALALEGGVALPDHLVVDAPVRYGDYAPENYDGSWVGLVPLHEALAFSLNVPFVRVLSRVGMEPFLGALDEMGVSSLHREKGEKGEEGFYGLSAALGALEVTPLEMARIYTTLARNGVDAPLRLRAGGDTAEEAVRIFGPAAAHLTRRALARRDRPDFPARRRATGADPPAIHWKTGTSYGHRDAWAVGSGPAFTAVVWLGNFDATPARDLVGADAAGPILFDLLEAVEPAGAQRRAPWPEDLQTVEVCAWSGHLPTAACPSTRIVLAPRNSVASRRCPLHVQLEIDRATGLAVLPGCRENRPTEERTFRVWPDAVRALEESRGASLPRLPPVAPACRDRRVRTAGTLRFASPPTDADVRLIPGIPRSDQQIPLLVEGAVGEVSWFVDGRLVGRTVADEELWWEPSPGRHVLHASVDGAGVSRTVVVRAAGRGSPATGAQR